MTISQQFPQLPHGGYRKTSECSNEYNCIAWALGETNRWYDPEFAPGFGCYWPDDVSRGRGVNAVAELFEKVAGYVHCGQSEGLEDGFQKICIYYDFHGDFGHVALQTASGKWSSKLGGREDIEHNQPNGLCGGSSSYGEIAFFMKRPVQRLS